MLSNVLFVDFYSSIINKNHEKFVSDMDKIKKSWNYWGENDPYYAVVTFDEYRKENLTESNKEAFFQTGYDHLNKLWAEIENNLVENFKPRRGLDFGCGVGRVVIPLAERCEKVVGVDISELMIEEAVRNCERRKIANTEFLQTDEFLSGTVGEFDFVHSFIVFQHINPLQGEKILIKIIESLSVGGIGVLHFTYANAPDDRSFWRFRIYRDYPIVHQLKNLVRGGSKEPLIPMYIYNLNKIFSLMQENDCHKCSVLFSFHGMNGVVIIFQKTKNLNF